MGQILSARDEDLHRDVAIKRMKLIGDRSGDTPRSPPVSRQVARFVEEAQVTGQLDHPGIVPVHELGLDSDGRLYFAMKLVRGRTLRDVFDLAWNATEDWSVTRVVDALLRVCEAMSYAHEHRVIHRDLKPGNIMVGRFGEVFVMDWGLARILDRPDAKDIRIRVDAAMDVVSDRHTNEPNSPDSPLKTMDGDVLGTPAYMSPEQASGNVERIGVQTDVYAIGAILYHLLTRRMPFVTPGVRADNYAIWKALQQGPPIPIARLAPDAPAELVAICEMAMSRDLAQRYASAVELAADLRAYLENRVVHAHRTGPIVELRKWIVRNKAASSSMAAVGLVVLCAALLVAWKERERANEAAISVDEQNAATLLTRADSLWPIDPSRVGEMDSWVLDAKAAAARESDYAARLTELKSNGRAVTLDAPVDAQFAIIDASNRAAALASVLDRHRQDEPEVLDILPPEIDYWNGRAVAIAESVPLDTWTFTVSDEQRAFDRLSALVRRERSLGERTIPEVASRREVAATLWRSSISDHSDEWARATASIGDRASCPSYAGLKLEPQLGLVPLGRNRRTGLFEFWHVLSGTRPRPREDGGFEMTGETGLVFVLIPGGRTRIGAQSVDPHADNFDPQASFTEAIQDVDLAPYFLSKYEMTQGQWYRATADMPSHYWAGTSLAQTPRVSRAHPVENVDWNTCATVLAHRGLLLPTEAQWERGARGGTSHRYGAEDDFASIACELNSADASLLKIQSKSVPPGLVDDGYGVHAPVGSFPPNAFGLYDTLGNVAEWCRDWYADSCDASRASAGDGERMPAFSQTKSFRGGCFKYGASDLRISRRLHQGPNGRDEIIGLRPARAVQ